MGNVLGAARCVGELRGGHKRTRNNEWKPPPVSCVFSKWAVLFGHGSPGKPRSTFLNCLCCKAELLLLFSRLYVKAGDYDGKYGGKQPLSAKADTSARSLLFPASSFFFFFRCGIRKEPPWLCNHVKNLFEVKKYSAWKCLQLKKLGESG